ncbi:hypothetical protein CNMCM7691_005248 [Aspergillus felis]|uniref:Uncharacterized protein n=1 Tax=Aspergillus felis TaxID=1287682 RepID=A0A8H6R4N2_9EURO|nr:hypothetical protein CNMCM7691_005248 [Aspergillus felis]
MKLVRHNPPWHHHRRFSSDEHLSAHRQDDTQGPRSHLPRHDQHPRLHDPVLHPPRQLASGYPARGRPAEAQEQGAQGDGSGPRRPRRWWTGRR